MPALERPDAEEALLDTGSGSSTGPTAPTRTRWHTRSCPGGSFGIADSAWAVHLLGLREAMPSTRYHALSRCLPMLRAVKDRGELTASPWPARPPTRRTTRSSACGSPAAASPTSPTDLARLLREFGHEKVDFTVVGSGPNGANPHHEAGERVIEPGDAVVLDFGGLMHGYGSDTTRTVSVGEPGDEVRAVHDVVRAAQQAAFEAVAPGVPCEDDRPGRAGVITEAGYGNRFIHRTGHGIGVTTHEPPYLVEGERQPLRPGMCFSIEPGVYLPGRFGVRIEDIVTVIDGGGHGSTTPTTRCGGGVGDPMGISKAGGRT